MTIPNDLRIQRLKMKLTQDELGRSSAVDADTIRNLENGKGSIEALQKVMVGLSMKVGGLPKADTLGEGISLQREKVGFSHRALARAANVSHPSIANLERSQGRVKTLYAVLRALGVSQRLLSSSQVAAVNDIDNQKSILRKFIQTLESGKAVPKRKLESVLTEQDFIDLADSWENMKGYRDEMTTLPSDLEHYVSLLAKADRKNMVLGRFGSRHRDDPAKRSTIQKMINEVDGAYETALEALQETLLQNPGMEIFLDRPVSFEIGHEPSICADGMPRWWASKSHYVFEGKFGFQTRRDILIQALERKLDKLENPEAYEIDKAAIQARLDHLKKLNSRYR